MICHHYKCIFVHIPKNAGQSVEHVFLNSLGLNWETRAPLLLRKNDQPSLGPPRLAHLTAKDYVACQYLSQELFDRYYKFTFVRNPWSRMVSLYKYLGFEPKCCFGDFLKKQFVPKIYTDMHWFVCPQKDLIYTESGEVLVDYIGRFETLQEDFSTVCKTIGFPETILPHVNQSVETKKNRSALVREVTSLFGTPWRRKKTTARRSYRDYYDQETIDLVAELYREDIDTFNYSFDA